MYACAPWDSSPGSAASRSVSSARASTPSLLCEYWEPASDVLKQRFDADVVGDICDLESLPKVDVVTAGFPCTDLSQVGRTAGIDGTESGLVREAFRLIEETPPRWVVLENVPNMLSLNGGAAMSFIADWFEERGWNWAYRTVDSQHFGLRQRRRRVFLVASRTEDPQRRPLRGRGWRSHFADDSRRLRLLLD